MSELHDSELVHVISHQLKLIRGEIRPCHSLHTPSGVKKKNSEDRKVRWTTHSILHYKLRIYYILRRYLSLAVEWHIQYIICVYGSLMPGWLIIKPCTPGSSFIKSVMFFTSPLPCLFICLRSACKVAPLPRSPVQPQIYAWQQKLIRHQLTHANQQALVYWC